MISSNKGGRLAPLLIGVTMRQSASRTAQVQASLPRPNPLALRWRATSTGNLHTGMFTTPADLPSSAFGYRSIAVLLTDVDAAHIRSN